MFRVSVKFAQVLVFEIILNGGSISAQSNHRHVHPSIPCEPPRDGTVCCCSYYLMRPRFVAAPTFFASTLVRHRPRCLRWFPFLGNCSVLVFSFRATTIPVWWKGLWLRYWRRPQRTPRAVSAGLTDACWVIGCVGSGKIQRRRRGVEPASMQAGHD